VAELADLPTGRQARKIMFYVYAIKSVIRDYIYVGLTADTKKRIAEHKDKKEKMTCSYAPFTKRAISKTPCAVIPAKAGIQYFQGVLDCPIKSGNDNERGFTNGLLVTLYWLKNTIPESKPGKERNI